MLRQKLGPTLCHHVGWQCSFQTNQNVALFLNSFEPPAKVHAAM